MAGALSVARILSGAREGTLTAKGAHGGRTWALLCCRAGCRRIAALLHREVVDAPPVSALPRPVGIDRAGHLSRAGAGRHRGATPMSHPAEPAVPAAAGRKATVPVSIHRESAARCEHGQLLRLHAAVQGPRGTARPLPRPRSGRARLS